MINTIDKVQKIEIPMSRKKILIRVNLGNKSPFFRNDFEWPNKGGVQKYGGRGLFGINIEGENMMYLRYLPFNKFNLPSFVIIEVDNLKIEVAYLEVEFRECNVLFNGDANSFLSEVKCYASKDAYRRITEALQPIVEISKYDIEAIAYAIRHNPDKLTSEQNKLIRFYWKMRNEYMSAMREMLHKDLGMKRTLQY